MATSPKHRLEQRDKVLLAARKCFIRHGFHATGMAEIAKACRMSVGNIYHYFPHKNAIVQAITDEIRSRMLPVLRPLADHADPVEGLIKIMLLSVREICTGSNARLWMEILAEVPRNKIIRNICLTFDRDLRDLLERLMQRAMRAGQLPPDIDLEATSLWLVALLDGAIARLSAQPDLDLTRTQDTLAQNMRRFFRTGAI
ncbi:MAG TPA: TetR/AcrR family transcriptional regulator [Clostridia bacterium]|nr:TetR/AcrR family transcriptional regulator [Clostridia bacterium]